MTIDEHTPDAALLMAYADGELDATQAARVEALLARDPEAAGIVAAHRALRARVDAAFANVLDEPVPARLQAAVAPQDERTGPVVRRRRRTSTARRWPMPPSISRNLLAMAASLLVGIAIGAASLLPRLGGPRDVGLVDADMVARNSLADALDRQLSGPSTGPVRVALSFRATDGRYCRAFAVQKVHPVAGIACRTGVDWQVTTLAQDSAAQAGQMRQATTQMPAAVLADIDARIRGESLDAKAERDAKARGWR
jgi:anti-sigma factor RsiW